MSSNLNREGLLKTLNLVRPALSNQSYVPILTHFCFDGVWVMGYNDVQAIAVRTAAGIEASVPGELFVKLLGSLSAEQISLSESDSHIVITGGRSRLKLPTLPVSDFVFDFPKGKSLGSFKVSDDVVRGIEKCSTSIGTDPTHPSQMGITLDPTGERCALYSTDNHAISRYFVDITPDLPGDAPVILPTFFCTQMAQLAKAFPNEEIEVEIYSGAMVAHIGDQAKLFTKLVLDIEPMDFEKIISKHASSAKIDKRSMTIPDNFYKAFKRADLIVGSDADPKTNVSVEGKKMNLSSVTSHGEVKDIITLDGEAADGLDFNINPARVLTALPVGSKFAPLDSVLVVTDDKGKFLHMIAHCA